MHTAKTPPPRVSVPRVPSTALATARNATSPTAATDGADRGLAPDAERRDHRTAAVPGGPPGARPPPSRRRLSRTGAESDRGSTVAEERTPRRIA